MNDKLDLLFGQPLPGYACDITMVIDATGGMSHFIDKVKENAVAICDRFRDVMGVNGKFVEQLRVKVITFRDYAYTDRPALECSEFFNLPEQNEEFRTWVQHITAKGGGDEPESALEALAMAMRSDWTTAGSRHRHIILLFTDAPAVELNDPLRTCHPEYPENMPKNLEELSQMWNGTSPTLGGMPEERSARLVVFAPNVYPWNELACYWNYIWCVYSKAGVGLSEVDIDTALYMCI